MTNRGKHPKFISSFHVSTHKLCSHVLVCLCDSVARTRAWECAVSQRFSCRWLKNKAGRNISQTHHGLNLQMCYDPRCWFLALSPHKWISSYSSTSESLYSCPCFGQNNTLTSITRVKNVPGEAEVWKGIKAVRVSTCPSSHCVSIIHWIQNDRCSEL